MIPVSLIIKNHLNSAIFETKLNLNPEWTQERLRFVNYLVHMFPDTNTKIDADEVYEQFKLGNK